MIPSKESVVYGRRVVLDALERFHRFELAALAEGNPERAERHRVRRQGLEHLLGYGGCVVAPFDARWLDDEFRQWHDMYGGS